MQKEKVYITTTLPYVNAKPHIGFAMEIVRADVYARYQKSLGKDIFFNTGTDEHGQKIYDNAIEKGVSPQAYVDEFAFEFRKLIPELGILSEIHFIRTTDEHHKKSAQEMWRRCRENGDIYKAQHVVKYCKGCELEKTDSELEDGKCSLHPTYIVELRDEENYFFRFSKYQDALLALYTDNSDFVVPNFRLEEIKSFVSRGLQDFSVSRLKSKMSWGIPVPDDEEHVMYVWFDALTNYISVLGWPEKEDFDAWWPGVQFAGKDNLRQQSAIWQAMLFSAGLPHSKQVIIGGFVTSGGQKMSKSLGNVIDPFVVREKYGTEALRYFLTRHTHPFEDSDVTMERIDEIYHAHLVNGLGNLVSRVMKMAEDNLTSPVAVVDVPFTKEFTEKFDTYRFDEAMDIIFAQIQKADLRIQEAQPFKMCKSEDGAIVEAGKQILRELVQEVYAIAGQLVPFMPNTAEKIRQSVLTNKKPENLFPRLEK